MQKFTCVTRRNMLNKVANEVKFLKQLHSELSNELALCGFCARIGLQYSPNQLKNQAAVLHYAIEGRNTWNVLQNVENTIGETNLLLQNENEAASAIFKLIYPLISTVLSKSERQQNFLKLTLLCREFSSLTGSPIHFLGETRIGGQIDCMPLPLETRKNAEMTTALNTNYKKKDSQRKQEKSNKQGSEVDLSDKITAAKKLLLTSTSIEDKLNISQAIFGECTIIRHSPAKTVADLLLSLESETTGKPNTIIFKNLFLRGKVKSTGEKVFILISVMFDFDLNFKELTKIVEKKFDLKLKGALRQGTENELFELLHAKPGEISPLALIYERSSPLYLITNKKYLQQVNTIWVHPYTNEATVGIAGDKLGAFIRATVEPCNTCFLDE